MNTLSIKQLSQSKTLKKLITPILSIIVLTTITITAWQLNQTYQLTAPLLSLSFAIGTGLAIVYRVINPVGWVWILKGMGHPVDTVSTTKIWLMSESRRWLPGGVWGYASRALAAGDLGVSKTAASASMAFELLITIAAAVIVSLLGIAWHFTELSSAVDSLLRENQIQLAHVAMVIGLGLISTWVLFAARKTIASKIEKARQKFAAVRSTKLDAKWLTRSLIYMIFMAALNGIVNAALLPAIDPNHVPIMAMIAATSIAWTIGFLAIFSPGGILVREAALAAVLLPWLPWESGFALAILSRFAQLIAEVVGMGLAMASSSSRQ